MKIFVFEYASAGGADKTHLLTEGYGMLRSVCDSLSSAGHEVHTLLDPRISKLGIKPPADKVEICSSPWEMERVLSHVDACVPIAPDSVLYDITKMIEAETSLIGCSPKSVSSCSNKNETYELVSNMAKHFDVPEYESLPLDVDAVMGYCDKIGFPVVIKPIDGAGCDGISMIGSNEKIPDAIKKVSEASKASELIVQKFCEGRHMSCSIICSKSHVLPVSINSQRIEIAEKIRYLGGVSPHPSAHKEEIFEESRRIAKKLRLFGFVGIDLVVSRDKIFFMEINPRITTPFIALSGITQLGELLIDCLDDSLPSTINLRGFGAVAILPLKKGCAHIEYKKLQQIPRLISPPFPMGNRFIQDASKVLISVHDQSLSGIANEIDGVKKKLLKAGITC
ncbi:MAG: ATP-grasp domain-containing protein [Methanocellales archaeon]|nr:ATP-grasp domain-containing protein [Methanocellales archaeon]